MKVNKIACMIVTYNRCELLKQCLDALDEQTCQDFDILVLNNGSSDNTLNYIKGRQKSTKKNLIIETVPVNLGMAYGYNRGYASVFGRGYDWIWTMDDDGMPEKHQLEILLREQKKTGLMYLNALVCDIEDHSKLAFTIQGQMLVSGVEGKYIYGEVRPDNGTLINRIIFEKIGNIKSELISYGMETEYVERKKKYTSFKIATVVNAIHYHPMKYDKCTYVINFRGIQRLPVYNSQFMGSQRYWQYVRSLGYINKNYRSKVGSIKTLGKNILYFLLRFRFFSSFKWYIVYREGMTNKFSEL